MSSSKRKRESEFVFVWRGQGKDETSSSSKSSSSVSSSSSASPHVKLVTVSEGDTRDLRRKLVHCTLLKKRAADAADSNSYPDFDSDSEDSDSVPILSAQLPEPRSQTYVLKKTAEEYQGEEGEGEGEEEQQEEEGEEEEETSKRKRKKEDGSKSNVKYKGVSKQRSGRFRAQITIDGKSIKHGTFDTPKEAAQAYDLAAIQAGRPTSKLNFLDEVPKDYKPKKRKYKKTNFFSNTTGFKGVYKSVYKNGNRFRAAIRIDGKNQSLGMFDTPKEAAQAFDRAAIQAGRPTSQLNFPPSFSSNSSSFHKKFSRKMRRDVYTTEYKGVYKIGEKFVLIISIFGQTWSRGMFDTKMEAALAWDHAAIQTKRPRSSLNFPSSETSRTSSSSDSSSDADSSSSSSSSSSSYSSSSSASSSSSVSPQVRRMESLEPIAEPEGDTHDLRRRLAHRILSKNIDIESTDISYATPPAPKATTSTSTTTTSTTTINITAATIMPYINVVQEGDLYRVFTTDGKKSLLDAFTAKEAYYAAFGFSSDDESDDNLHVLYM